MKKLIEKFRVKQPNPHIEPELPKGEYNFTVFLNHPKWRWKNFSPKEMACKGTGLLLIDEDAMDKLQDLREILGIPFTPNSAYRSLEHNRKLRSKDTSMHRFGKAFDIPITTVLTRKIIHENARLAGFTGFGDYNTFVHIDTGIPRYWDERK